MRIQGAAGTEKAEAASSMRHADQRRAVVGFNRTFSMTPEIYPVVGKFKNETSVTMTLYLEMVPEEVILEPGDEIELLARPTDNLLPLDIAPVEDGLHIHAHKETDPDWHVRFRGQVIKAGNPTRLSAYRFETKLGTPALGSFTTAARPTTAGHGHHLEKMKKTRLTWLVRVGYVLISVGILLLLPLSDLLPVDLFGDSHHYYRVVPTERSWVMEATSIGIGMLLVLVGRTLRTKDQ